MVTVISHQRRPRFEDFAAASAVARIVADPRAWHGTLVIAWVLMPDHWHAVIQLGPMFSLSTTMQRVNSLSARSANVAIGKCGQVWQSAFHDRALCAEEDVREAARYVVANPTRAGLVKHIGDYPLWGAIWLDPSHNPLTP